MRNIYYTYHVVNKMRPVDIYDFNTIKEIVKFTGLSTSSITECLEGEKIKGWTITRTPLPKKEKLVKEASPKTFGVLVYLPNGEVRYFRTQKECAKALGICESTVFHRLKDGKPDKHGNEYDYPA